MILKPTIQVKAEYKELKEFFEKLTVKFAKPISDAALFIANRMKRFGAAYTVLIHIPDEDWIFSIEPSYDDDKFAFSIVDNLDYLKEAAIIKMPGINSMSLEDEEEFAGKLVKHLKDISSEIIEKSSIDVNSIFNRFSGQLEQRFIENSFTTEDSVRYTFFYILTKYGKINPSDVVLEYPHPKISGAKIDTYVPQNKGNEGLAIEFKFNRKIPSNKNAPSPQKAGKVFADIFRLALLNSPGIRRYLIYVTDKEMATYFQNPSNNLNDFFNLQPLSNLIIDDEYVKKMSLTFIKNIGKHTTKCMITCNMATELSSDYWLRIYEIKSLDYYKK